MNKSADQVYNKNNPKDIERFAKLLIGKSLRNLVDPSDVEQMTPGKGKLGTATEKYYFHINPGNSPLPDFLEAGVELKTGRIIERKSGWCAKDRMVLSKIDFDTIHGESFETSSFWKKNKLLLMMFYLLEGERHGLEYLDAIFKLAKLFEFPEADLKIIKQDWEKIAEKVRSGLAHELSEGDTNYLAACPKGINKEDTTAQPYSEEEAMKRAYSLKQGYVTSIVRKMIDAEPIVKDTSLIDEAVTFEDLVIGKFKPYVGKTIEAIVQQLDLPINSQDKAFLDKVSRTILGVKTKKIEEFEKGNIQLNTMRLRKNGTPKEDISFPYFRYKDLAIENWVESPLREKLEKRWFFVVYQYNNENELVLKKVLFWAMPYKDLMNAKKVWVETKTRISAGKADKLPGMTENPVCHVRPHGRNSADKSETPQGVMLPKKSFWLNRQYIKNQVS